MLAIDSNTTQRTRQFFMDIPALEDGQLVAIADPKDRHAIVSLHWTGYGDELAALDRVRATFSPEAQICAVVDMSRIAFQLYTRDWALDGLRYVGALYRGEVMELIDDLVREEEARYGLAA